MRIPLLFIFLTPFLAISQINQTDLNGLRQGFWQKNQPNGQLLYQGNFKDNKPVGEWKRYHTGGQVKAIIGYRADSDSADARLFDEWGKKVAEGIYLNEKKSGLWTYYSENVKIAAEHFQEGLKQGESVRFFETGETGEISNWVAGEQEGNYSVFFKNGNPFFQCKMKNNKRNGLCLTYFRNGRVELEAHYVNGLRDGEWKYFDENGNHIYSLIYNNGKILNPGVRDSISNLQMQKLEKGKGTITDPEKYMDNPSEYLLKMNVYR